MGASAQGMGGMGGMGGSMAADTKPRAAKPAPRAKRHYYRSSRKGAVAGSCGLHKYWSKGACKDARTHPPSLK
jgi:hypothetical protein